MTNRRPACETVRLAEFDALRSEIQERSGRQQTLIGLALTATTVVSGAVLTEEVGSAVLLVLPATSIPLGFLWLDHALCIDALGAYIRDRLWIWTPSWEEHIRGPSRWEVGAFMLPITMVFAGPAVVALVVSCSQLHTDRWPLWAGGALLVALFAARAAGFLLRKRGDARP